MKFTFYGHASFSVLAGETKLLFDPFISPNPLAAHINIETIEADYILLSHGHSDHVADAVSIAKRTGAKVICNYEVHEWLQQQGVTNTHPMNLGGTVRLDFGTVKCVVAQHSSRMPDGSYGGNPMGFVVTTMKESFYYAGDTALTYDMTLIPFWAKIDFAVLPIGDNFTMDVADAIKAAEFVQTNKVIGVHYDTFGYIIIDKPLSKALFEATGKQLLLPNIGETIEIG